MKPALMSMIRLGLALLLIGIASNCAGSKSGSQGTTPSSDDDYGEIEELLGISEEKEKTPSPASQDDNLLELLQSGENPPAPTQPAPAATNARIQELEREISNLQRKLDEKDQTIAMLRQQLVAMENQRATPPPAAPVSNRPPRSSSDSNYEREYDQALRAFHARRYRDAIAMFEALLDRDMNHSLSDNAQYWIGECYYALGDYRAAILAFEKVFTFKNSNKNDFAQFKLGQCYYQLNERERARQEFQTLVDNYPKSSLISRARQYLASL